MIRHNELEDFAEGFGAVVVIAVVLALAGVVGVAVVMTGALR